MCRSTFLGGGDHDNPCVETTPSPPWAIIEEISILGIDGKEDAAETEQSTSVSLNKVIQPNDEFLKDVGIDGSTEHAKIMLEDISPKSHNFLVDMNNDAKTIINLATKIVHGFNDNYHDNICDDARTITTQRMTATKVQPVSAAF
jgi:hypothetical protein